MSMSDWARADMNPDDPGSQGYSGDRGPLREEWLRRLTPLTLDDLVRLADLSGLNDALATALEARRVAQEQNLASALVKLRERYDTDPKFRRAVEYVLDVRDRVHRDGFLPADDALTVTALIEEALR